MDANQQLEELMERYLSGKMTDAEIAEFELQMEQNPQLKREVDLHRRIVDAVKAKNLKKILQNKEQAMRRAQQRRRYFIRAISGGAVAACIALGVLFITNDNADYIDYGARFYDEFSLPVMRGGGDKADSLISAAYEEIGTADYDATLKNLDAALEILRQETFDTSTDEGIEFQEVSKRKKDDAEWLKAITYMKQGEKCKAKKILKQIAESESRYQSSAKEILER